MLNLYRLKELTMFDFCHSLAKLKSLAFILPYFLFWSVFFIYIIDIAVEKIQSEQGLFIASYMMNNQELITNLFIERPATLSIFLIVSTTITPLFILLAANNQYSSDAARGAFRFILTRTTRAELYVSRFIAVTLLVFSCLFITSVWASLLAYLNGEANLQATSIFGLQTFFLLCFYSLPFITFMSAVSTFTRSAFGCLFTGLMLYVVILIIGLLLSDELGYSIYLIPSGLKAILIDINFENALTSIAALSCYTLVYFFCGWFIFKRRDM
ncbi:MAG: hypothetical protein AAF419_01975 [Pseudomonadota bacterium]